MKRLWDYTVGGLRGAFRKAGLEYSTAAVRALQEAYEDETVEEVAEYGLVEIPAAQRGRKQLVACRFTVRGKRYVLAAPMVKGGAA